MIRKRGNNVIVRSQFNIRGSRGKSVKPFVTDYVTREDACSPSMAHLSTDHMIQGDGVSFTLDATSVSRTETLRLADVAEEYFLRGDRAVQQMVISFAHEYLVEQGIVQDDVSIYKRGDYEGEYDDVRLRHAVRAGVQTLCDAEGYRDPSMVAALQHDTLHLHVHVVVYENYPEVARKRGKEEKGLIKPSSFNQLTHEIDRVLTHTRSQGQVPSEKKLIPKTNTKSTKPVVQVLPTEQMDMWLKYLEVFRDLESERAEAMRLEQEKIDNEEEEIKLAEERTKEVSLDLDKFMDNFYNNQIK